MRFSVLAGGWLLALLMQLLRLTCRVRWHEDPRPAMRQAGQAYAYALLHCHQGAGIIFGERGAATMVSRSGDGEIVMPSIRSRRLVPVRGSTTKYGRDRGGQEALGRLVEYVREGTPALLTVDGPCGPRNRVSPGIARIGKDASAAVLILIPVPTRRWVLARTWDRLQIPKPFSRTDVYFGEPLRCGDEESVEEFRQRIERSIIELEERHDPVEAAEGRRAAVEQAAKLAHEAVRDGQAAG
jgi:lysophospholipid acyltransferase (LPLAT)-like uncharacterized protein